MTDRRARARSRILIPLAASALVLTACAPGGDWPGSVPSTAPDAAPTATTSPGAAAGDATNAPGREPEPTSAPSSPGAAADTCDWEAPRLSGSSGSAPSGQRGDVRDVVVGAWQHTHVDAGDGFEALDDEDIRYVFPSATEILYCQHVPGITDHAENRGAITWDGTTIILPGGALRFTVTDWSETAMRWHNHLDDSTYLLVRR